MFRFALVAATLALSLLPIDRAISQTTFPLVKRTPTPPSDLTELRAWCKSHVYRRHGERRTVNGREIWHIGDASHADRITDTCVRGKGRMFRGVVYPEQKQAARTSPQSKRAAPRLPPPPTDREALVKWCHAVTLMRHAQRAPEYDRELSGRAVIIESDLHARVQDACIRSKGRSF